MQASCCDLLLTKIGAVWEFLKEGYYFYGYWIYQTVWAGLPADALPSKSRIVSKMHKLDST